MKRPLPWLWIVLPLALVLLPGPAGRLVLDLLGGLTLTVLLLPLLAGAAGLIVWQIFKRRLRSCSACGFVSTGLPQCPACGADLTQQSDPAIFTADGATDASQATIDVEALDVSDHQG